MSFDFYLFKLRLSNVLSVNTESLFKLPSGLSNMFFIATAPDNYIFKVGSFAIEIRFQIKWLIPILQSKEFNLYNTITTIATIYAFCYFEAWFIFEKFEEHIIRIHMQFI